MSVELSLCERIDKDNNEYHHYDLNLRCEDEEKIKELAKEVRKSYVKMLSLQDKFPETSPLNTNQVRQMLFSSRIPHWQEGVEDKFQVVRSEFGEIISKLAFTKLFNTKVPLSRLLNKENPLLPTRGIDIVGVEFEGESPIIVIGEVKTSDERKNPPGVVHKSGSKDCLEARMPYLLTTKQDIVDELMYYVDQCENEEDKKLFLEIALSFAQNPNDILIIGIPCLIRHSAAYNNKDIGNLLEFSGNNRKVRFVLIKVDENINNLSKKVYEVARSGVI